MAPLLFLSIQNRSGRKCSRMANSSALPFPIPSGVEDVVPLDEGIRDCGGWSTTSVTAEVHLGLGTWCKGNERTRFCGSLCTKSKGLKFRKGPKLGARETKEQGFAGVFAPSSRGWSSEKGQRLGAKETEE